MKYIKLILLLCVAWAFTACDNEKLSNTSVFDSAVTETPNELDLWLKKNYVDKYNIQFLYRYKDSETNNTYNVIPPSYEKAQAMAILIQHVWIDAYNEVMGEDFMKTYSPRILQMLGSFQYKGDGSRTIGTAEGGVKVTLFGCNTIDLDDLWIDQDSPYTIRDTQKTDLNYWYFHTMHHEFCHILTQKKNYPAEFQEVSVSHQRLGDWTNVRDSVAPTYGFVSGYASSEYNEDFAEIYSIYVTHTAEAWAQIMADAARRAKDETLDGRSETADTDISTKLEMVKQYFKESWGLDMDELRTVVLRRSKEALVLDLRNLPKN